MEEIPEINIYLQRINRSSILDPNDTATTFIQYNYAVIGKLIKKLFFSPFNKSKEISHL